jgi:hypothetical protein
VTAPYGELRDGLVWQEGAVVHGWLCLRERCLARGEVVSRSDNAARAAAAVHVRATGHQVVVYRELALVSPQRSAA